MVETVGAKNCGLIVDIVHVVRIGIPYEKVNRIPLRYLINVELNDGTMPGNPNHDASGARKFCGEGEFDIKGFIQSIKKTGYAGPWAVEVFSKEVAAMSLEESNTRAFKTTMAQFEGLE
jgi:sugar phosphate isomerase/epimerase